ncbi:MAG: hypothetical protein ACFBSG_17595 [Leptolyngbyaceae cyanobacterium]
MNHRVSYQQRAIALFNAFLKVCLAVLFCLSSFATPAWANQAVTAYQVVDIPAAGSTVRVQPTNPCNGGGINVDSRVPSCNGTPVADGAPTGDVDMNFGQGFNRTLQGLVVGGRTFVPQSPQVPGGLLDRVVFQRGGLNATLPAPRVQLFYEQTAFNAGATPPSIDLGPTAASLADGLRSLVINRGVDNIFNNATESANGAETQNNIERVDYISDGGINVPVAERDDFGFWVGDRANNGADPFRVAAITGLAGGNPSAYGPLRVAEIDNTNQNALGVATFPTVVTRIDNTTDPTTVIQQPSHRTGSAQNVRGRFFSIADLLEPEDTTTTTIFGYSVFPGDVDPVGANNAVPSTDVNTYPTDTDSNSAGADGGIDLIAGGAFFAVEPDPEIGVAKTVSAPRIVDLATGIYDIDLTIRVTNTGNTALNNVQLTEDLQDTFITNASGTTPAAAFNRADSFVIQAGPTVDTSGVTGTVPTLNGGYNGTGTNTLFNAGNAFNVNDTAVVTLTVRVTLGALGGAAPNTDGILVTNNQANASGTSPGGQTVTDLSDNGSNVDPDGDGDPTNDNDPTPIQIPFPSIGVAKSVSGFTQVAVTTQYDFDFTIIVTNSGATNLTDVTLQEDLQAALITNATNRVDSFVIRATPTVTTTGFTAAGAVGPTINGAYNGVGNIELFSGSNLFTPGDTATVIVPVRAELGAGGAGPLNDGIVVAQNTATASGLPSGPGVPPGTGRITDESQSGGNVDPDGDGNPGNNTDPTPIAFPATTTDLVIVKRITNIFRQGAALAVPGIANFNDQPGDTNDNNLNAALGGGNQLAGIFQLPAGFGLESNDEVEYTIYFWNSSAGQITQLNICDELQAPSVLNTGVAFELAAVGALGTPTFGPAGNTVQGRSPGAPLEAFCPSAPGSFPLGPPGPTGGLGVGAGGGVIAGPFTVPANQFGGIRFRVRIP